MKTKVIAISAEQIKTVKSFIEAICVFQNGTKRKTINGFKVSLLRPVEGNFHVELYGTEAFVNGLDAAIYAFLTCADLGYISIKE